MVVEADTKFPVVEEVVVDIDSNSEEEEEVEHEDGADDGCDNSNLEVFEGMKK